MLTPEIMQLRKSGIAGSDSAAVCGLSHWKTRMDVYLDKVSDQTTEEPAECEGVMSPLKRGTLLEPLVKLFFEARHGRKVDACKSMIRSDDHHFMIGNLDGVMPREKAIVEFKTCATGRKHFGEEYTDDIPNEYLIQVHHYLSLFKPNEAVCAYVPVLFGDMTLLNVLATVVEKLGVSKALDLVGSNQFHLRIYKVNRSEEFTEALIRTCGRFWHENVQKRVPPSCETISDVQRLFAEKQDGKIIQADAETIGLQNSLKETDEKIRELEAQKDQLKVRLGEKIGDASELVLPDGKTIKWIKSIVNRLDTTKLKSALPDVYTQFLKPTESQRLYY